MSSSLLIDENPVLFQPSLARLLGVNGAILVQQLHFLLNLPRCGRERDGEKWIYNTYEDWQRDYFPFWSIKTIKRAFRELEKMHVVISDQFEGRHSRRKYYRLNRGMIPKLTKENCPPMPEGDEMDPSGLDDPEGDTLTPSLKGPTCPLPMGQVVPFLTSETSSSETRLLSATYPKKEKVLSKRETPSRPSLSKAEEYGATLNLEIQESARFFDYHQSRGWTVGGTKIKDWKAKMRLWRTEHELKQSAEPEPKGPAKCNLA